MAAKVRLLEYSLRWDVVPLVSAAFLPGDLPLGANTVAEIPIPDAAKDHAGTIVFRAEIVSHPAAPGLALAAPDGSRVRGVCMLTVSPWLWERTEPFRTVDTWVPLFDHSGVSAGALHVEFVGSKEEPEAPANPATTLKVTVQRAVLQTRASAVLHASASDADVDCRVKMRVHPGRASDTTSLSDEAAGLNPEWNQDLVALVPQGKRKDVDYAPCLSFRVLHENVGRDADLFGLGVLIVPVAQLRASPSPQRMVMPLSNGGGVLFVTVAASPATSLSEVAPGVESAIKANKSTITGGLSASLSKGRLHRKLAHETDDHEAIKRLVAAMKCGERNTDTLIGAECLREVFERAATKAGVLSSEDVAKSGTVFGKKAAGAADAADVVLDTVVSVSDVRRELNDWGSENQYGLSLGDDIPARWFARVVRLRRDLEYITFQMAIHEENVEASPSFGATALAYAAFTAKTSAPPSPAAASAGGGSVPHPQPAGAGAPSGDADAPDGEDSVGVSLSSLARAAARLKPLDGASVMGRVEADVEVDTDDDSDADDEPAMRWQEELQEADGSEAGITLLAFAVSIDRWFHGQLEMDTKLNDARELAVIQDFADRPSALRKLFDKVDMDKDGQVSRDELRKFLLLSEREWVLPHPKFSDVDIAGDGTISWDEFKAWVDHLREERTRMSVWAVARTKVILSARRKRRERDRFTRVEALKHLQEAFGSPSGDHTGPGAVWRHRLNAMAAVNINQKARKDMLAIREVETARAAVNNVVWTSSTTFVAHTDADGRAAAKAVSSTLASLCSGSNPGAGVLSRFKAAMGRGAAASKPRTASPAVKFQDPDFGPPVEEASAAETLNGKWRQWLATQGVKVPDVAPHRLTPEASAKSLYREGTPPRRGYPAPDAIVWKSIGHGEKASLWSDGADSSDPQQGALGDCWLLGGMSLIATRDDLLYEAFDGSLPPDKRLQYSVNLIRFSKGHDWHYVIVDDRVPHYAANNTVTFAKCKVPHEMWVPLLEKAYAKLHGSYDSLIGGYIDSAVRDLTGLPTLTYLLPYSFVPPDKRLQYSVNLSRLSKGHDWHYVIVDDRVPHYAANNTVTFAKCKVPHEMWVPLLEKAYAKLHGSYDSLIGGYIDSAVRDLTGLPTLTYLLPYSFVPPLYRRKWAAEYGGSTLFPTTDLKPSDVDPNTMYTIEDEHKAAEVLWARLRDLRGSGAMIGCSHRCTGIGHTLNDESGSEDLDYDEEEDMGDEVEEEDDVIDVDPRHERSVTVVCKPRTRRDQVARAEAPIGCGILQRHAYSVVDLQVVDGYRLVRVRNPWGQGEWKGAWSDSSLEVEEHRLDLHEAFSAKIDFKRGRTNVEVEPYGVDPNDGTFLMNFYDFREVFTHVFAVVDFPLEWPVQEARGAWQQPHCAGGNVSNVKSWVSNPKFYLTVGAGAPGAPPVKHVMRDGTPKPAGVPSKRVTLFVELGQSDPRLKYGKDVNKHFNSITIHMLHASSKPCEGEDELCESELERRRLRLPGEFLPNSLPRIPQLTYQKKLSVSFEANIPHGEYILVPSLATAGVEGDFYVTVVADQAVWLRTAEEEAARVEAAAVAASPELHPGTLGACSEELTRSLQSMSGSQMFSRSQVLSRRDSKTLMSRSRSRQKSLQKLAAPPEADEALIKPNADEDSEDDSTFAVEAPPGAKKSSIAASGAAKKARSQAARLAELREREKGWLTRRDELFRSRQRDARDAAHVKALKLRDDERAVARAHAKAEAAAVHAEASGATESKTEPVALAVAAASQVVDWEAKYREALRTRDEAWKQLRDMNLKLRKAKPKDGPKEDKDAARRARILEREEAWRKARDEAFRARKALAEHTPKRKPKPAPATEPKPAARKDPKPVVRAPKVVSRATAPPHTAQAAKAEAPPAASQPPLNRGPSARPSENPRQARPVSRRSRHRRAARPKLKPKVGLRRARRVSEAGPRRSATPTVQPLVVPTQDFKTSLGRLFAMGPEGFADNEDGGDESLPPGVGGAPAAPAAAPAVESSELGAAGSLHVQLGRVRGLKLPPSTDVRAVVEVHPWETTTCKTVWMPLDEKGEADWDDDLHLGFPGAHADEFPAFVVEVWAATGSEAPTRVAAVAVPVGTYLAQPYGTLRQSWVPLYTAPDDGVVRTADDVDTDDIGEVYLMVRFEPKGGAASATPTPLPADGDRMCMAGEFDKEVKGSSFLGESGLPSPPQVHSASPSVAPPPRRPPAFADSPVTPPSASRRLHHTEPSPVRVPGSQLTTPHRVAPADPLIDPAWAHLTPMYRRGHKLMALTRAPSTGGLDADWVPSSVYAYVDVTEQSQPYALRFVARVRQPPLAAARVVSAATLQWMMQLDSRLGGSTASGRTPSKADPQARNAEKAMRRFVTGGKAPKPEHVIHWILQRMVLQHDPLVDPADTRLVLTGEDSTSASLTMSRGASAATLGSTRGGHMAAIKSMRRSASEAVPLRPHQGTMEARLASAQELGASMARGGMGLPRTPSFPASTAPVEMAVRGRRVDDFDLDLEPAAGMASTAPVRLPAAGSTTAAFARTLDTDFGSAFGGSEPSDVADTRPSVGSDMWQQYARNSELVTRVGVWEQRRHLTSGDVFFWNPFTKAGTYDIGRVDHPTVANMEERVAPGGSRLGGTAPTRMRRRSTPAPVPKRGGNPTGAAWEAGANKYVLARRTKDALDLEYRRRVRAEQDLQRFQDARERARMAHDDAAQQRATNQTESMVHQVVGILETREKQERVRAVREARRVGNAKYPFKSVLGTRHAPGPVLGPGPLPPAPEVRPPSPVHTWDGNGRRVLPEPEFDDEAVGGDEALPPEAPRPEVHAEDRENVVMRVLRSVRKLARTRKGAAAVQRAFKSFDRDNSRTLNVYEFHDALVSLGVPVDEYESQTLVDTFDASKDGVIDYGEFMFVFFDRRAVLAKWQAAAREGPRVDPALRAARFRAQLTSFGNSRIRADGLVSRKAVESVLLKEGLFSSSGFPMSALLDHLEAMVRKSRKGTPIVSHMINADDVVLYVSNPSKALDAARFGQRVKP